MYGLWSPLGFSILLIVSFNVRFLSGFFILFFSHVVVPKFIWIKCIVMGFLARDLDTVSLQLIEAVAWLHKREWGGQVSGINLLSFVQLHLKLFKRVSCWAQKGIQRPPFDCLLLKMGSYHPYIILNQLNIKDILLNMLCLVFPVGCVIF